MPNNSTFNFFCFDFLVIFFLLKKRRPARTDVILTGLCDSGKTLLYGLLMSGKPVETFTSITENFGQVATNKGSVKIVDIPGHERLRIKFLDKYRYSSKAVTFIIDSSTIQKDIRDVADYLYTILADKAFSSVPILIVCNKQDETFAKSQTVVENLLEKEFNVIRKTRTSQLESVDDSSSNAVFLGRHDKDFSFSQLNRKIIFAEASAKEQNIDSFSKWIQSL
jgi:signal recognition particle receptor subunit beta